MSCADAEEDAYDLFLPKSIDAESFQNLLSNPPFTRSLNLAGSLALTGVFYMEGKAMVTVRDLATGKSRLISETPNEEGWRLVEVATDTNLNRVSAKIIAAGGEVMQVRYDEASIRPVPTKNTSNAQNPTSGPDNRPKPTDDERKKFGEAVRARFSTMNEDQRRKVGELMQEKMKDTGGMSDRQKGEIFMKVLDQVAPQKN